ncbi:MAG: hypothetical protein EZS28_019948 [Streblomastix strix]|uniref:Tc1-like transposase DDE domain-containing protein n=1 Tax=Streblomastix strix TaxID=222440 RepID=A0A5J4VQJ2_9EUKA|nr:MAG: hypothetical protein EZS28_019948 [Streblomastix strix]
MKLIYHHVVVTEPIAQTQFKSVKNDSSITGEELQQAILKENETVIAVSTANEFLRQYEGSGVEIIFIDETPCHSMEFKHYGRAPVGQLAIKQRKRVEISNVSAITAISALSGVIHVLFVVGSIDAEIFILCMIGLLKHQYVSAISQNKKYEPCIFIIDNVRLHHSEMLQELMNKYKYTVLFTAPYSCELNPIEYVALRREDLSIRDEQRIFAADVLKEGLTADFEEETEDEKDIIVQEKKEDNDVQKKNIKDLEKNAREEQEEIIQMRREEWQITLTDPNLDRKFLEQICKTEGFKIQDPVGWPGDCLFNSIACQQRGAQPATLRQQVVDEYNQNPGEYMEDFTSQKARDEYIAAIAKYGTLGGEREIKALLVILKLSIILHSRLKNDGFYEYKQKESN